jgi:hypothetical protein
LKEFRNITHTGNYQKRLSKLTITFKSYGSPKNSTVSIEKTGALGLSVKDFHEKMTFMNGAFWKVYFAPKVGKLISQNPEQQLFRNWLIGSRIKSLGEKHVV